MVCRNSPVNASFAFALLSELVLLSLLILHLLPTFGLAAIRPALLGNYASVSAGIFLVFGVICLAALGGDCIDIATSDSFISGDARLLSRLNYAFRWGILDILLFVCLATFILLRILVKRQSILFKANEAAPVPPVQQQPHAQPGGQPQYAQPAQPAYTQPAQPQYAQPAQPQYAQPAQPQYAQPAPAPVYAQPPPAEYALAPPTSGA